MSTGNPPEDRKFVVFSPLSIQTYAESEGFKDVPENVLHALAEDASYRVREMISKSCLFMRQGKRKFLKAADVDKALYWSDMPSVTGAPETLEFVQLGDITCQPDSIANLKHVADGEIPMHVSHPLKLTSQWINPVSSSPAGSSDAEGQIVESSPRKVNNSYTEYYTALVECILSDNKELFCHLLEDITKNAKISPTLPFMVNFLSTTNLVSHDLGKLSWMMYVINALFTNPVISLNEYVMPLLNSVMYCVLEPLAASINPLNDHWILRDYGARLLAKIITSQPASSNFLLAHLHSSLKQILMDPTRPLCSHYGAVMAIGALGSKTAQGLLIPQLNKYVTEVLDPFLNDLSLTNVHLKEDAHKVLGAVKRCMEKQPLPFIQSSTECTLSKRHVEDIKDLFGDSLTTWMQECGNKPHSNDMTYTNNSSQFMFHYKLNVDSPNVCVKGAQCYEDMFEERKNLIIPSDIVIRFGHPKPPKRRSYKQKTKSINDSVFPNSPWSFCFSKMHARRPSHLCDTTQWCL
uniref:TAF6-like RNA polymerase II p300/CBP-associated factor-associated factor 65 kDa subunit 6L n=1 Tax=Phallusia mammillata TaxID=59560 RepID=A0A6F9DUW1_9ASCI|nr:TAF6-like RNA polymerase II p300/CBP-associated factor-associated factor 65 kDa subunit 6L [Phallusia mammillata]